MKMTNSSMSWDYTQNWSISRHMGTVARLLSAYAVAHFKDGGYQMEFMPKSEIEKRRKRSASANSSYSPWSSDYEEMAKKTVVRYMFKYLPISIEVQTRSKTKWCEKILQKNQSLSKWNWKSKRNYL